MKAHTQKVTKIFTAFGAWAGRGIVPLRGGQANLAEDMVQEYEAGVMPVLPERGAPTFDERAL